MDEANFVKVWKGLYYYKVERSEQKIALFDKDALAHRLNKNKSICKVWAKKAWLHNLTKQASSKP